MYVVFLFTSVFIVNKRVNYIKVSVDLQLRMMFSVVPIRAVLHFGDIRVVPHSSGYTLF